VNTNIVQFKKYEGFTLSQNPDKGHPWEVLRDVHPPPSVPAEALQQS